MDFLEFAGGNLGVNAGDVHLHDASGADVEVADFAVAHLSVGQSDEMLAGADEGIGKLAQQLVVGGLAGQGDGVVGGFGAVAPSVEDGEYEGMLGHGWFSLEASGIRGVGLGTQVPKSEGPWGTRFLALAPSRCS
jgi:hypothetical protein